MSFLGKRYRRTKHENLGDLLNIPATFKDIIHILDKGSPIFCYTKVGDKKYSFVLQANDKHMAYTFTLDEEREVERRDGKKFRIMYSSPSENVLNQVFKTPDGKTVYFAREFTADGKEARMTVSMDGTDAKAIVYFEAIE